MNTSLDNLMLSKLAKSDLSSLIIGVDFDGTCVFHDFPAVGEEVPHVVDVLKALSLGGAKLILWTMRSDRQSTIIGSPTETDAAFFLQHAVDWFAERGIPLFGVNHNPEQSSWTDSPKAYAHIYVDDAALGCPLMHGFHDRPCVYWLQVGRMILAKFTLEQK